MHKIKKSGGNGNKIQESGKESQTSVEGPKIQEEGTTLISQIGQRMQSVDC